MSLGTRVDQATDVALEIQELCVTIGKAVLEFLQSCQEGADFADILRHVRVTNRDLQTQQLESCLADGVRYGFLEKIGLRYSVPCKQRRT